MKTLRFALRRWRRRPGLAITATLVLALGIGATTAMFSIVDAVLLRAEPWPDADRLVRVYAVQPQQRTNPAFERTWNRSLVSWQTWRDLQKSPVFEDVAAWSEEPFIIGDETTELTQAFVGSSTLLSILGFSPAMGRPFNAADEVSDTGVVVISHGLWTRMFGRDPDIIGKVTTVTPPGTSGQSAGDRRMIVGVLPADFRFPGAPVDVLIPIGYRAYVGSYPASRFLRVIAKVAATSSVGAAASAAEPLVRREEPPDRRTSRVVTLRTDRIGLGDQPLWLMLAAAGLLVVVACANVAGLLLSDARSRRHETAVRLSLGGTRLAILRALLVEHLVLAAAAAAGGVLLAKWLIPSLVALAPPGLVGDQTVGLDNQTAGWAIAATFITTLLAGIIPAAALSAARPGETLKANAREHTRGGRWRHRFVVSAQFTVALVLLVGAGLFGETLLRLGQEPLGFSPERVTAFALTKGRVQQREAWTPEERAKLNEYRKTNMDAFIGMLEGRQFMPMQSLLERVASTPGVQRAAFTYAVPFTSSNPSSARVRAEGQPVAEAQPVFMYIVTRGYFDVMNIPLLRGRMFDREFELVGTRLPPAGAQLRTVPVLVSETLARRMLAGDRIGRRLLAEKVAYDVIGVVGDVKQRDVLDDDTAAIYQLTPSANSVRYLVTRAADDATAIVPAVRSAIEQSGVMFASSIAPLSDLVGSTMVVQRSRALLSSAYGLVALLLASVGLYGLAARLVVERRREIGIRVALGAGRRHIRRLVMADAWMIVGIGLVVGVPVAFIATRATQNLLFGVAPAAPHVLAFAALVLTCAAVVATLIPVWRANRIDPAVTLRDE